MASLSAVFPTGKKKKKKIRLYFWNSEILNPQLRGKSSHADIKSSAVVFCIFFSATNSFAAVRMSVSLSGGSVTQWTTVETDPMSLPTAVSAMLFLSKWYNTKNVPPFFWEAELLMGILIEPELWGIMVLCLLSFFFHFLLFCI